MATTEHKLIHMYQEEVIASRKIYIIYHFELYLNVLYISQELEVVRNGDSGILYPICQTSDQINAC